MARNVSPGAAGTKFATAVGLAELPQTAGTLEAGQISEPTARAVVRETDALHRDDRIVVDAERRRTARPDVGASRSADPPPWSSPAADAAHERAERNRAASVSPTRRATSSGSGRPRAGGTARACRQRPNGPGLRGPVMNFEGQIVHSGRTSRRQPRHRRRRASASVDRRPGRRHRHPRPRLRTTTSGSSMTSRPAPSAAFSRVAGRVEERDRTRPTSRRFDGPLNGFTEPATGTDAVNQAATAVSATSTTSMTAPTEARPPAATVKDSADEVTPSNTNPAGPSPARSRHHLAHPHRPHLHQPRTHRAHPTTNVGSRPWRNARTRRA